jgi:hypothetical protein
MRLCGMHTSFVREGSVWAESSVLERGLFRVRLGGSFRGAWLAAICKQLAEHRLSIDHVHARISFGELWIAELHLRPLAGATNPSKLRYLELLGGAPSSEPSLALDSYRVSESSDYGGALVLSVEARDSLGLLGALLLTLARVELFPVELHIETREARAYDTLWLMTRNRTAPSASLKNALARELDGCVGQRLAE